MTATKTWEIIHTDPNTHEEDLVAAGTHTQMTATLAEITDDESFNDDPADYRITKAE
jgi:hypothetical protein